MSLLAKEVTVPAKYLDFANVFSKVSAEVLQECSKINKNVIKSEDGKQPSYGSIYSLELVEPMTLKT